ncbi:putative amidoligase enzyme [Geosmithia morbida]|uniref:Amidoligase enzyme n=1 Tax=Geosmithia morbida TaxID=1094350 RepID=A0A9P4Z0R0_9HYPO|nr:putative amidoligase enzyme [Geosmithia morbida]KAF4124499.1 putative amidoligase enzyme [Geosmithia morbida]
MARHYNFGVEIEAVVKPYGGGDSFTNVDWYRQLAQKLRNRGIDAVHDDNSRYSKHPEYYGGKWFVTRDGSLKRERPMVCMEVVSPRLDTTLHVSNILSDFWEAMRVHFNPQKDTSCGGHVHVTPVSLNNKFSLKSLKKIAFATVVYEDFVAALLPPVRRNNKYCQANSRSLDSGLNEVLAWGRSASSLARVASDIYSCANEVELWMYMQGNRYVLWNFQNIFPNPKTGRCTGTVEFRGGNQFLSTNGTLAWVAFVLGFITLAQQEDLIRNFTSSIYVDSSDPKFQKRMGEWWNRLRKASKKSNLSRYLPEDYDKMKTK